MHKENNDSGKAMATSTNKINYSFVSIIVGLTQSLLLTGLEIWKNVTTNSIDVSSICIYVLNTLIKICLIGSVIYLYKTESEATKLVEDKPPVYNLSNCNVTFAINGKPIEKNTLCKTI